jgi:hypothetical protein
MRLIIKTLKGESYSIECEDSWQIAKIKMEIHRILSVELESQKLIYKGRNTENAKTLTELGINNEDTLVLMVMKVL